MFEGLVGIAGQHALVEAFDRRQRRPVTGQHVQKLEPFDVPPVRSATLVDPWGAMFTVNSFIPACIFPK